MRSTKNLKQLDEVPEQYQEQTQRPYDDQIKKYADVPVRTVNSSRSSSSQHGRMKNLHVNKASAASSQSKDYNISPSPDVND